MRRSSSHQAATHLEDDSLEVELIGLPDDSLSPEERVLRVEKLIAKIILLGRTKGRPKKVSEDKDESKTAA